jgi:rod shape determining protein RodA
MGTRDITGSFRFDYMLLISFIILTAFGILTIYSANTGSVNMRISESQHIKQIYWAITGIAIFIAMLFINYQKLGKWALIIYVAGILILMITLLFGKRVRGAKSWITFFRGFGFQPSEFVKIALVIALARFLERTGEDIKKFKNVILAFIIILVPTGLVLLQPDFGTALVYIPIGLVMLFFAGMKYSHLVSILIIFGIAISLPLITTLSKLTQSTGFSLLHVLDDTRIVLSIAVLFGALSFISFILFKITKKEIIFKATNIFLIFFAGLILSVVFGRYLKPYQKERLIVFLKPSIDPYGAGYNIIQSKIAVGAGGLFGRGLLGGTQSQLGFLPERSTDFIFSIFAEEWGFVGSFFLLAIFGFFIYRGIMIIYSTRDLFGHLMASGIVGMFLFHIIINIGMTIGIMPITGIPLPFMSYGGSFLLTCMAGSSILFNIEMRRYVH